MQPQPPYNYSAADIERYHNGSMTDAEMHALEKAALDDPFLADAIDGYMHTKTPAADVAFLKEQLQHRRTKVIPLTNSRRRLFLSVAAIIVLLAGFGWLALQLSNSNNKNIAVQKAAPSQEVQLPPSSITDSVRIVPEESNTLQKAAEPKQEPTRAIKTERKEQTNHQKAVSKKVDMNNDAVVAETQTFSNPHTAAPLSKAENGIAASRVVENTFKAKVVDEHNNAVPYATITDQQNNAIASTDTGGNFSIAAPDSNVTVAIKSVGYQQQQRTLMPTDSTTKIVLQPATNSLNEVVIARKSKPRDPSNRVTLEAAEPIGGLKRFNTFVGKSMEAAEDLDAPSEESEVVLSFDVDRSGNAINVLVEKSACPSCDTTAVRLIQQGAKWKKTKQDVKAKARIRF